MTAALKTASAIADLDAGTILATVEIAASPDVVYQVVTDYADYPRMVPLVKEAAIYESDAQTIKVRASVAGLFSRIHFSTINRLSPSERAVTWSLDSTATNDLRVMRNGGE